MRGTRLRRRAGAHRCGRQTCLLTKTRRLGSWGAMLRPETSWGWAIKTKTIIKIAPAKATVSIISRKKPPMMARIFHISFLFYIGGLRGTRRGIVWWSLVG